MPFMPFQILGLWFRGLLAPILLGLGIFLVADSIRGSGVFTRPNEYSAQPGSLRARGDRRREDQPSSAESAGRNDRHFGVNTSTGVLLCGAALVLWSLSGGWISSRFFFLRREVGPPTMPIRGDTHRLQRPDGTELHVECFGPRDGVPVIMTHGWGLDHHEWDYAHRELAGRCRLILWDLPGLGRSTPPSTKDWSLEKLAHDLAAVVTLAGDQPAILVGHSIGGMIILTYCRLFPEETKQRIGGVVLANSTYTNPVRTTSMAALYTVLQKPLLEPLCHLMIWMAPLVWLLNWISYLNGSMHRTNHRSFFSGNETREQLSRISRYSVHCWPGVIARGLLAMFRYDATPVLEAIPVPTLIFDGRRDKTCTTEAGDRMMQSIPNADRHTMPSARHGAPFEFHKEFAAELHKFVTVRSMEFETRAARPSWTGDGPHSPPLQQPTGRPPSDKHLVDGAP